MKTNIEFTERLKKRINLIDDMLISIGQEPISSNKYVDIDYDWTWEHYTRFTLSRPGAVSFYFEIGNYEIEIRIDDHCEALCYDEKYLETNKDHVIHELATILTKKCRIVRKGKRRMIIYFLDENDNSLMSFKYWTNTILNAEEGTFEYPPFFDKK